jgi:hypothetical protein
VGEVVVFVAIGGVREVEAVGVVFGDGVGGGEVADADVVVEAVVLVEGAVAVFEVVGEGFERGECGLVVELGVVVLVERNFHEIGGDYFEVAADFAFFCDGFEL